MLCDRELVRIVDAAVAEAARRAGDHLQCRKGCTHCCIGPFAVTVADLDRLRVGLAIADPSQQERILDRARECRSAMRDGFPGDWKSGIVASQQASDTFDLLHATLPCPVLDLETGECSLHAWRPVACRLHGPALQLDDLFLPHCRLNYQALDANQIEAMRVRVQLPAAPESALTYIAFL